MIVTATSGGGTKSFSTNHLIALGKEIGYDQELIEIEDTKLYPNPSSSNQTLLRAELDIEDDRVDVQISVMNVQGRLVKIAKFENVKNEFFEKKIDLSGLKNGLYFVNISASNRFNQTKKLVIQ